MTSPKPKAVIFDIDGTLSDYAHRAHHLSSDRSKSDWPAFFAEMGQDGLISWCHDLLLNAHKKGHIIILLTGRPSTYQGETLAWLQKHGVPHHLLLMRPQDDWRPGNIMKADLYHTQIKPHYDILFAVDDNPKILDMWQTLGVVAFATYTTDLPETL
mgnify:CR=1 FL=1